MRRQYYKDLDEAVKSFKDKAAQNGKPSEVQQSGDVMIHMTQEYTVFSYYGVRYQKCGGGRRIIRKTSGGGN